MHLILIDVVNNMYICSSCGLVILCNGYRLVNFLMLDYILLSVDVPLYLCKKLVYAALKFWLYLNEELEQV